MSEVETETPVLNGSSETKKKKPRPLAQKRAPLAKAKKRRASAASSKPISAPKKKRGKTAKWSDTKAQLVVHATHALLTKFDKALPRLGKSLKIAAKVTRGSVLRALVERAIK